MDGAQPVMQAYILCQVGGTTCGLPSHAVQHLELIPAITRVPDTPPFVEGVVMARGLVVPVVNLRLRLGLPWQPHDLRGRLVVIRHAERTIGLLVDSAREFVRLPVEAVQPPPSGGGEISPAYLAGVVPLGERLILVLRVEAILGDAPPADTEV